MNEQGFSLAHRARARVIEIDGDRGVVTEMGDRGPTLVLLPSMLVLGKSYTWLTRVLCRQFRMMIIEMPGCGEGSVLAEAWSFEQYSEWLEKALERMGAAEASRPIVIGHSNSGPAAVILAERRPELVGGLVVVDGVGVNPTKSLVRVLGGRAIDAVIEGRLTLWGFHHILFNMARHWRNFWNQVWLAVRYDVMGRARGVTTPTLVAWGRRDHTMSLRGGEAMARVMSGARMYVSTTGSHDWLITEAGEFAEILATFAQMTNPQCP